MQKLFVVNRTVQEMVQDRGYVIPTDDLQLFGTTAEVFVQSMYRARQSQPTISVRSLLNREFFTGDRKRSILVFYGGREKSQISVAVTTEFIERAKHYTEAIFVVDADLSPQAMSNLKNLVQTRWQIFKDQELTYNPTKHVLTPKHVLLTSEEAAAKFREWGGDRSNMLLIDAHDPIVKYYGWPPGGIVKIYRDDVFISILVRKTIAYRLILG
jgi:DNA-directed RNA polymerase I, II, and III subunit RPABC1